MPTGHWLLYATYVVLEKSPNLGWYMQKCSFSEKQHFCVCLTLTAKLRIVERRDSHGIREHFSIALVCQRDIGLTYVVLEKSPNLGWYMQKVLLFEKQHFCLCLTLTAKLRIVET